MKQILSHLFVAALIFAPGSMLRADSFTEPSTIFYGKVLGSGANQAQLLHEGSIRWLVQTGDGATVELSAELSALKDGEFSYRLAVPHSVLALGLAPLTNSVPMGASETVATVPRIEVDGEEAVIVGSFANAFFSASELRTSTYRLDLEVPLPSVDTDGDGLPDWWEDRYGLDKQDPNDALADGDGDGLNNLEELEGGYDPTQDSRQPLLATTEQVVFADASNALILRTLDSDSTADQLTYTLLRTPSEGSVRRAPGGEVLAEGDRFLGDDLLQGKVVYSHDGANAFPVSIELAVEDENTNHTASTGTVWLYPYRPSSDVLESGYVQNGEIPKAIDLYLLASSGSQVVLDAGNARYGIDAAAPSVSLGGSDSGMLFLSGPEADGFTGGGGEDVFVPGAGDDRFTGGGGPDLLRVDADATGRDTWLDPSAEDVLDLSRQLQGSSPWLSDYIEVVADAEGTVLRIRPDGLPATEPYELVLVGVNSEAVDLAAWVETGRLLIGELQTLPRVFVEAPESNASENGPTSASFSVYRTGPVDAALSVALQWGGVAVNGVDYSLMPASVTFDVGENHVELSIAPFADSSPEPDEVVEITVLEGAGYEIGTPGIAQLLIEDLKIEVSLETLVSHGVGSTMDAALLLVKRTELLDQDVLVRLDLGGSAVAGLDYQSFLTYIHLSPGQTSQLVPIQPLYGADYSAGAKTVQISIVPDASYRLGDPSEARVLLVQAKDSLTSWRTRTYPSSTESLNQFIVQSGDSGYAHLLEYALNPEHPRPRLEWRDGEWNLDVWVRPEAADIGIVVEFSNDLSSWYEADSLVERVYPVEYQDEAALHSFLLPGAKERSSDLIRARLVFRP